MPPKVNDWEGLWEQTSLAAPLRQLSNSYKGDPVDHRGNRKREQPEDTNTAPP